MKKTFSDSTLTCKDGVWVVTPYMYGYLPKGNEADEVSFGAHCCWAAVAAGLLLSLFALVNTSANPPAVESSASAIHTTYQMS